MKTKKIALRETTLGRVVKPHSLKIEKNREESNGIRRPSIGGICRHVWDRLDAFKQCPSFEQLRSLIKRYRWSTNTAVTQYQRWKAFHGVQPENDEDEE